jgi:hypothetical protein
VKSEAWRVTADLLRLRRWAVSVLSHAPLRLAPPQTDETTFDLFLRIERCAAALLEALGNNDRTETLRKAAAAESQSYLRARVDAFALESIALSENAPIVVLKGGVHAIRGDAPTIPLSDIDILVPEHAMQRVVEIIESRGMGEADRATSRHRTIRSGADQLPVEVHWKLSHDGSSVDPSLWTRLQPLSDHSSLMRLGARDHVLHLLLHAILVHRNSSVTLRDTILIGLAAHDCSEDDIIAVRKDISRDDAHEHLESLLVFATAMINGAPTVDPFEESCATSYSAAALSPSLPRTVASRPAVTFAVERELARVPWMRSMKNANTLLGPAHLAYHAAVAAVVRPMLRATARRALASLT